ncbi:MAG: preprotein translocase subunit SecA [bacterium]|nr:preprotein translocase subunit SecA [bacterium]
MIKLIKNKLFGTGNERELKRMVPRVEEINSFEPHMVKLSDDELKAFTGKFKERLRNGEALDDLLPEAFAVVRETGKRVLNMRHFDVQLVGGIVLHQGRIAEMKTGEGKTLVATLAGYLNALEGKGVHVVTVNDYLAGRDSQWMGQIYEFLGLSVGVIQHEMNDEERKAAYNCDITYGTNNEFGFDFLRDNMKFEEENLAQREFSFAIVDEVDSILIDEARTPLIISGPTDESTSVYYSVNDFVKRAKKDKENYELDEKSKTVVLTEQGINEAEKFFKVDNLYDLSNMDTLHQIYQSLKAHLIFGRDVDYLVNDNQVVIVDEFTGRMMPGRRFSDGLHQALEAKENVRIEQEYQTLATITFQNLFRMYRKLSGMTGTAATEATEFQSIYGLDVLEIPTNKTLIRLENPDVIYGSLEEKWDAVSEGIKELNERGQPVLVGTISIENSELVSRRLKKEKIKHVVLNAKYHDTEADIVAMAGRVGAVTIATNMAGRGTDILLGGNPDAILKENLKKKGYKPETAPPIVLEEMQKEAIETAKREQQEVLKLGGLHILGTERHEARRIDNQLRGRSGRQGDPGSSRFYISLEDDLMRILGSDRVKGMLVRVGMSDGVPIENKLVSRAIENAQKQIESQNFSMRKHLLEYDDVMNKQRQYVYAQRRKILKGTDLKEDIAERIESIFEDIFNFYYDESKDPDQWDYNSLHKEILSQFGVDINDLLGEDHEDLPLQEIRDTIFNHLQKIYRDKGELIGSEMMRELERTIMMQQIDSQWKDNLLNIDHLKEGIGLRGYAQKDPLIEYKKESFELFEQMQGRIEEEAIRFLYLLQPVQEDEMEDYKRKKRTKLSKPSSKLPGRKRKKKKRK